MIGVEEVCRLHEAALGVNGDEPRRLIPRQVERLKGALDLARVGGIEKPPIEAIAMTAVMIRRVEAFVRGNRRTALVVAATLLERSGEPHTTDWLAVARALSEPPGDLGKAIEQVRCALLPR